MNTILNRVGAGETSFSLDNLTVTVTGVGSIFARDPNVTPFNLDIR